MSHGLVKRKILAGEIFNCENLKKFIDSITAILPYKGVSESKFYTCEYETVQWLTKLSFYKKNDAELYGGSTEDCQHTVDTEIAILRKLKETMIETGYTPCILEIIYDKVCSHISNVLPSTHACDRLTLDHVDFDNPEDDVNARICRYNDLIKAGIGHDKYAFIVLERCDITMGHYMNLLTPTPVNVAIFKSIIFQIIHAMVMITSVFPDFRHNDLHSDNVMLRFDTAYKFKASDQKFLVFRADNVQYTVPYFGIIAKLIDFGYAVIPDHACSNIVNDKKIMYMRSANDLLFLFHHIYNESRGHPAIDKILFSLDPTRSYVRYYTPHIRKIANEIPTYLQMLQSKTFKEYQKHNVQKSQVYGTFGREE